MIPFPLLQRSPSPIRARLLRDLVLLIIFTVGVLVGINLLLIRGVKHDLAATRIDAATSQIRDQVRALLFPVHQQLLIQRDLLKGAGVEPADREELNNRLLPTLAHMAQVAGAIDAAADGREYFLRRDGDNWLTRLRPAGTQGRLTIERWDPEMRQIGSQQLASGYDPRQRPWFLGAAETPGRVFWSQPYIFASLEVPGVTAAVAWNDGTQLRVAALDVTLKSILDAIDRLDLGTQGQGFLFTGNGGVFLPEQSAETISVDQTRSGFISAQTSLGGPLQFDAIAAWKASGEPQNDILRFQSGSQSWWAGFRRLTDNDDGIWIGVAIPASATMAALQDRWHLVGLTAGGILLASLSLAILLVRKYSRQLRDLPKLSIDKRRPEQELRELIASGEGQHLEFKSTMRMNLHSKTPGKEIELAWLKGVTAFLNTDGGILLLGVADDGTLLGLAADKFENEDKCRLHFKNLLTQHLGPEYARLVRFFLHDLDAVRIGAVECERSEAPVFLRDDKKRELFIIRTGPSNIELSISRALKYIRQRF